MKKLPANQQAQILRQKLPNGQDVFSLAVKSGLTDIVRTQFESIITLEALEDVPEIKYSLLQQASANKGFLNKTLLDSIWEKDLQIILDRLKPKDSDKNIEHARYTKAMDFYNDLKKDLDAYLNSDKSLPKLDTFTRQWTGKIEAARLDNDTPTQSNSSILDYFKTILLILSVVGTIYLAYQAGANVDRNKNALFSSNQQKDTDRLKSRFNAKIIQERNTEDEAPPYAHREASTPSAPPKK